MWGRGNRGVNISSLSKVEKKNGCPADPNQIGTSNQSQTEFLTPEQIIRIDKILATVGEYGEVHLIIQRGELRYINRVESYKAWNDKHE